MLEKLKELMGESSSPGQQPSDNPGQGQEGPAFDEPVEPAKGLTGDDSQERILKKKTGLKSSDLPSEYQKLIDAFNSSQKQ